MPMYHLALVAVLLIPTVESLFNCRNHGDGVCLNSGKCNFFGNCECGADYKGFDCGLYSPPNYTRPACTVACENGGTCRYGNACYCPYEYVGDRCQYPRTGPICKMDSMVLVAYRDHSFHGELYVRHHKTACKLVVHKSEIPGMKKFFRPLFFSGKYGCKPEKTVNQTTGDVTYTVDVISTYNYGEFGYGDSTKRMTCVYRTSSPGFVKDTTGDIRFIKTMVISPNTQEPVQVREENEKIILHFMPEGINDVRGTMVHFLEIYSKRGSNVVKKKLVEDGCVVPTIDATHGLVKIYTELKDGIYVGKVELKTFILIPGEPLLLNYRVRLCSGICPWPTCPPPMPTTLAPAVV